MEVRVSAQIVYEESQDMDQYATRIHLYALFRALFSRELALQLFCWARHESLVFSGVFTGEEVPRE